VTTVMLALTSKEQYLDWGWRIPFLLGCVLAFGFLFYYRTVPESAMWQEAEKSEAPLKEVLSGSHLRNLAQVFLMMSGFWLVGQPSNVLPSIMIQHLHVPSEMTTSGFFWASIVLFFGFVSYGLVGQMIGRRRTIMLAGVIALIVASLLYYAMVVHATAGGSALSTTLLAAAFHVMVLSPWGIVTTYICERFPTRIRASGYGIGYSVAIIIPSFSGIYLLWLGQVMPYLLAPIVLIVIAALLMIVGAALGPETREVELHLPDLGREQVAPPGMAAPHSA
jgi:MFS family permease